MSPEQSSILAENPAVTSRVDADSKWLTPQDIEHLVHAEQVRMVYQQSIPATAISLIAATLLCVLLWPYTSHTILLAWGGTVLFGGSVRALVVLLYWRRHPKSMTVYAWERAVTWSQILITLIWGLGAVLIMPEDSLLHQLAVYFFLTGLSAGSATMNASHRRLSIVMMCCIMVPSTLWFLGSGGLTPTILALAGMLYMATMLRATKVMGGFLQSSLRFAHELQQAKAKAENLARTDTLTGLSNRRAFGEMCAAALSRAHRRGEAVAMIMIDVDHFKKINDTLGHAAGDEALVHLAKLLRQVLREADICGRLGGEEFAVLLQDAQASAAERVAEKIRALVEASPVTFDGQTFRMTASFGVAHGLPKFDDLLRGADAALYQAKAQGRNRVVCHKASESAAELDATPAISGKHAS